MGCLKWGAAALVAGFAIVILNVMVSPGGVLSSAPRDYSRDAASYCGAAAGQMVDAGYGRLSGPAVVSAIGAGDRTEFMCGMTLDGERYVVRVRPVCGEPFECASIRAVEDARGGAVWVRGSE